MLRCLFSFRKTLGNVTENGTCECEEKYQWNSDLVQCEPNCSTLENTIGNVTAYRTCECEEIYQWNADVPQC